ncbi:flippase-like domain-containing protein [Candidatus Micrarchaeota archaeon]|nr:flippase-like domain-containing protein [Candidatus Micrarchaeota archaeon]
MDSRTKYLLNIVGSIIIFILIFYFLDIGKVLGVLSYANIPLIILALIAYVLINLIMSFRIKVVLEKLGIKLQIPEILKSNFAGMLASDFTPARSGYFFTAFSLSSRFNLPIDKTILSIFGPQLFDFTIKISSVAILTLLMVSVLGVADMDGFLIAVSILIMFSAILFFGLLLVYPPLLEKFAFIKKIAVGRKAFYLFHMMQKNSKSLLEIKWEIVGITITSWVVKGVEWFLLAKAVGISLFSNDLYMIGFMMILQGAITVLHFLPIPTLAGGGTSEAAFVGLLALFGIKPEVALAFGILTRLVMILIDASGIPTIFEYIKDGGIGKLFRDLEDVENRAQEN